MFFDTASGVGRALIMGAVSYAMVVLILRTSGKRTLASLNVFDMVVTIALGSILATATLSEEITLAEAAAAIVVLVVAQFVVAWTSVRSRVVRSAVRSEPALLVSHGRLLDDALRRSRVSAGEVRQAIRSSGNGGIESIAAVVLETDGTLSVIAGPSLGSGNALAEVEGHGDRAD